ncbi:MAG: 50S ribosomal protein L29 [Desulfobacterales bacterium]|nr:50S ribosomal protein L29 [Desulfobacterales bacterium]
MKWKELKDLSSPELTNKLVELKQALLNLRFQKVIGQLDNPNVIRKTKRTIARLKTLLSERELNLL